MIRILALGAGVQSTAVALMAERGEIPKIDHAIFADTQAEPQGVYRHLEWLRSTLSFPVHVVSRGSLRQEILDASAGKKGSWARPPLFVVNPDGTHGFTNRQCTGDYKIVPKLTKIKEIAGIKPRSRGPKQVAVEQIFGISFDEAHRMRDADYRWMRHDYPLVNIRMSRHGCLTWLSRHGYPRPTKSACTFCPYHSQDTWRELQRTDPVAFEDAVKLDEALRSGKHIGLYGTPFLHRQRIPLRLVDFTNGGQRELFGEECAGECGV